MIKKMIKLEDVAKVVGVSMATVSRVINNEKFVSEGVKARVNEAVKKLNYHPQWIARSLRKNKTDIISVIIPSIKDYWSAAVVESIEAYFRNKNKNLILFNTDRDPKLEMELLRLALSKRVDGIIFFATSKDENGIKKMINEIDHPIVIIDNRIDVGNADFVLADDVTGAFKLVSHLIKVHKMQRIACISGVLSESSGVDKVYGYKKALIENGIKINNDLIKEAFWDPFVSYNVTKELFSKKEKPDAIFCSNADIAIGAVRYLNDKRIKIPEDVAVVSFDDSEFIQAFNPPLTALSRIEAEIGTKAAELLELRITGELKDDFKIYKIRSDVIIRSSCGCNTKE